MKVALAQLNYKIGNFAYNEKLISDKILHAQKDEVDLIVFSEMAICGYPPDDLLEKTNFIKRSISAIEHIALKCDGIAAIIGGPSINSKNDGKKLFNSAYFLKDKAINQIIHKTLLPTYDVFDEYRHFEPGNSFITIPYRGERLAVTICEDIWDIVDKPLYTCRPMDELIKQHPTILINIAASPYHHQQPEIRFKVLEGNAKKYAIPLVYVNQTGGQTDLIFDGGSLVLNKKGELLKKLPLFDHGYDLIDLEKIHISEPIKHIKHKKTFLCYKALITGIRDYFTKMGFKKAVLGLSGGIDSAVVLVLASEALGNKNVKALLLPSKYSSQHSITDAIELAETIGVKHKIISIEESVAAIENTLADTFRETKKPDITEENIQARLRGMILMAFSNKFGHILLNASNKSEAAVGYGTLYGDMCGGLAPIGDLYKTEVYELAKYINRHQTIIPKNIISKPPSAELRPDQKDQDTLPPYEILDNILIKYLEENKDAEDIINESLDKEVVRKTIDLVNINEYKRYQAPPLLRLSSKAFGRGRRMPIVSKKD